MSTSADVDASAAAAPREARVYRIDEPVCCWQGHRFTENAGHVPHGWIRCTRRVGQAGKSVHCGEFVYVVHLGNGMIGAARVNYLEAYRVQRLQLSVAEAAEYLRLPWWRAAA